MDVKCQAQKGADTETIANSDIYIAEWWFELMAETAVETSGGEEDILPWNINGLKEKGPEDAGKPRIL